MGWSCLDGASPDGVKAWIGDRNALELVPIPVATRSLREVAQKARHVRWRAINRSLARPQSRDQRDRERNWREQHRCPPLDHAT